MRTLAAMCCAIFTVTTFVVCISSLKGWHNSAQGKALGMVLVLCSEACKADINN